MTRREVFLQAVAVTKRYGRMRATIDALHETTEDFSSSANCAIIGESGSGKSTFARILVGLERPTSGHVYWNGRELSTLSPNELREFRRDVQLVTQDTSSSFDPRRTLIDSVTQPLRHLSGLDRQSATKHAYETLEMLGLNLRLALRRPDDVSGGQRQRFAIARALVVRPAILLCDEVVSALDVSVQGSILNLLRAYCVEHGAALIFVSHGLPAAAFLSQRMIVMQDGRIVESGSTEQVVWAPCHAYTQQLIRAASA